VRHNKTNDQLYVTSSGYTRNEKERNPNPNLNPNSNPNSTDPKPNHSDSNLP